MNENQICDIEEPGNEQCDVMDRDAQGECPGALPSCNGLQIVIDDACLDCDAGDVAYDNICMTPSVTCGADEIVVDDACERCSAGTTVAANECVPTCTATQILINNVCVRCAKGHVNNGRNRCVSDPNDGCGDGKTLVDGACCDDLDGDRLCDSNPADDCVGWNNGDDADEDGFCSDTDCDDGDMYTYPDAAEICGLAVVNDCNNPCYETGCGVADVSAAKGATVFENTPAGETQWMDVTADVVGAGKVYEKAGLGSLFFCGEGPYLVDLRVSGEEDGLSVRAGIPLAEPPVLTAMGENRPVIDVRDGAHASVVGVTLQHKTGFAGAQGHGLRCRDASFTIQDSSFTNNAADQGAGVYSENCEIGIEGDLRFDTNTAEEGAAFFITEGSQSSGRNATLSFTSNKTTKPDSAALHVEAESYIRWSLTPTKPYAVFRANVDGQSKPRDIRVSTDAVLQIRSANFESAGAGHVRTDESTHLYGSNVNLVCDSSACSE